MRQTLSPPLASLNGWEEEAERIIGLGGGAGRLISWDDPGVVVGGSAVVGDPGTPQQLHRDPTSALLGQMADWLGAQPRQNIHSSRPQAGQSMFTLFSPSIALHNQHGPGQMWRIVKRRRERVY